MAHGGSRVGIVIPAAGHGVRMGVRRPKQFLEIDGKPIIVWTLELFQRVEEVDTIAVAIDSINRPLVEHFLRSNQVTKVCDIVPGGRERQDSVWNCLQALRPREIDLVLVHDAVRPFVDERLIRRTINELERNDAVVVAVRPIDTIKISRRDSYVSQTPPRESVWLAQTPQAFRFEVLYSAFLRAWADNFVGTDDASLVERLGVEVKVIEGSYDNIKITTPEDLERARSILTRHLM